MTNTEYVWLTDENYRRFPARLLSMGAHYSRVLYTRGGIDFEVLVSNDDIEFEREDNDG